MASLDEQILRIGSAIKKFDSVLKVGSDGSESLSIISSVKDVYMQHILADEFIGHRDISNGLIPNTSDYLVIERTGEDEDDYIEIFTDESY